MLSGMAGLFQPYSLGPVAFAGKNTEADSLEGSF